MQIGGVAGLWRARLQVLQPNSNFFPTKLKYNPNLSRRVRIVFLC